MGKIIDFLLGHPVEQSFQTKNVTTTAVPQHSAEVIENKIREEMSGANAMGVSAVYACARVIAEGLALPPCYLQQTGAKGRTFATEKPLYRLLNIRPNDRQTSYEFREQIGWHLALTGNAFVWLNRSRIGENRGEILEMLVMNPGDVTLLVDPTKPLAPVRYYLFGQEVPAGDIWHLKGPSWLNYEGMKAVSVARNAIGLARATEIYGAKLFENGARPGGLLNLKGSPTQDQIDMVRQAWAAQYSGAGSAHKTALLPGDIEYKPLASTANEAQFIESRRFQIEEACRYFRVSPTKVFQSLGSQSYASVEQAHIAHDQDTDAHWHTRFMQSATVNLLSDAERAAGYIITLDNRDFLRGTAVERMSYYTAGIAAGIFTRNEAREMEGFDRSDDPSADQLTPAANLFGPDQQNTPAE
ncbi:phage portal protein [Sphingobium yanoikuyae]|uniref:phage portal protein n=1 Tax=Sphingobium yanoikuyae TaxID=13690 RepID=UPI0028A8B625|nr:phage portal protein [Sphingobium yanoikuyae]